MRWLALALAATPASAAEFGLHRDSWRWAHYTVDSGLPADEVCQVLEADGVVWALGERGLAWSTGFGWSAVGPELGLPEGPVLRGALLGDDEIVVLQERRVFRGGTRGFREVPVSVEGVRHDAYDAMAFPGGGLLVVSIDEDGDAVLLRERDDGFAVLAPPAPMRNGESPCAWSTRAGHLYLSTIQGIARWQGSGWVVVEPSDQMFFTSTLLENEGGMGLAEVSYPYTHRGIWSWSSGGPLGQRVHVGRPMLDALAIGPSGAAVAAYDSGHVRLRPGPEAPWVPFEPWPFGIGRVGALAFRENGDLWVGAERGLFLCRRSAQRWRALDSGDPDDFDRISEILLARDGALWLATNGGVGRRAPGAAEPTWIDRAAGVDLRDVTGLAQDGAGHVWITSGSSMAGALRWDGERWERFGVEQGLSAERVHRVRVDAQGRPWFMGLDSHEERYVTTGPGAFCWTGERFEQVREGLPSGRVYDFVEDAEGAQWFGTSEGLARLRDGRWTTWTEADGLRAAKVFALAADPAGGIWFGHQDDHEGLGRLEPGRPPRYLTTAEGLAGNDVWELELDRRGWLWVSTDDGLSLVRGDQVLALREDAGLGLSRLWPVLAHGDEIYIGTLGRGLAVLDLAAIDTTPPRLGMVRSFVTRDRGVARWNATAHWGEQSPQQIETRWRLDGGAWSGWSRERERTFDDLSPGEHRLEVQARGLLGDVSPAPLELTFDVPRPLWRRPEFLTPVTLLSLSVLVLAVTMGGRKRAYAAERRRGERRYRDLFENASDLIWTLDARGRVTALNRAAAGALGVERETALERPLEAWLDEDSRPRLRAALERGRDVDEPVIEEVRLQGPGGALLELVVRRDDVGGPGGFRCSARDLTVRRQLEEDARQNQKMEALGRLAGGIAHDFNNLLTVINGYAEMVLKRGGLDDALRRRVQQILRSGEHAAALTRQLLAFGRKQVLSPRVLDLDRLVGDLETLLRSVLGEDIELVLRRAPGPVQVEADPTQLERVVLNLATNGRDAMPGGGRLTIEVGTRTRPAAEDGAQPRGLAVLSVGDTGGGIDRETRQRLFEPFFTTKEKGRGTGLGLSLVYGIVQQSGGEVEVDSEPGRGSTFHVLLPLTTAPLPPEPREAGHNGGGGNETLLLAEDEPPVRDLIRSQLEELGYRVLCAADGHEALDLARGHAGPIELLVTDVVMPRMDGRELARALARERPRTRVLYLSGHTGDSLARRGGEEDVAPMVSKPCSSAELGRAVRAVLDAGRNGSG